MQSGVNRIEGYRYSKNEYINRKYFLFILIFGIVLITRGKKKG